MYKKSRFMVWALLAGITGMVASGPVSAAEDETGTAVDPNLSRRADLIMTQQAEATLALVEEMLTAYPPQLEEPEQRKLALYLIDGIVHEDCAPKRPAVIDFFHKRMETAVTEMEQTTVTEGAVIWKLYDHGFVVRTASATLGFDLIYASYLGAFGVPEDLMARLIDQCDVLFVSHEHGDHCDPDVIGAFKKAGKPVLLPRGAGETSVQERTGEIRDGKASLKVVIFPGHQGTLENNVYLVTTPEGLSFAHLGDQHNYKDLDWIMEIHKSYEVDVIMPNCWTSGLGTTSEGFGAKLVITGHENELGHSIDHREAYWKSYGLLEDVKQPWILMTWGESYHYRRP